MLMQFLFSSHSSCCVCFLIFIFRVCIHRKRERKRDGKYDCFFLRLFWTIRGKGAGPKQKGNQKKL